MSSGIKVSEMTETTSISDNDLVMIVQNGVNKKISKKMMFADVSENIEGLKEKDTAINLKMETLQEENADLKERLQDAENNQLQGTSKGTSIDLEDSADSRVKSIALSGNSVQETTSGTNLLPTNIMTGKFINDAGDIQVNDKWNLSDYIEVSPNNLYCLSSAKLNSVVNVQLEIAEYNENKEFIKLNWYSTDTDSPKQVITTTNNTAYIIIGYRNDKDYKQLMVEKGNARTIYEPYTGAKSSPNPNYPQEVVSCGDNGYIIESIINKNVLDFTNYQEFTASNTYIALKANKFKLKASIEYIFNYTASGDFGTKNSIKLWFRDANNTSFKEVLANENFSLTKEELNKLSYIQVVLQALTSGNTYSGYIYPIIQLTTDINDIYVQHQSQTHTIPIQQPMRAIGEYKDDFAKINGTWYERHNIGEYIVTGQENWIIDGNNKFTVYKRVNNPSIDFNVLDGEQQLCNYYPTYDRTGNTQNSFGLGPDFIRINNVQKFTTVVEASNWLKEIASQGKPLKVQYPLKAPILIECTEAQIQALEKLEKARTYKGVTHIYSEDDVPANIDLTYIKDLETVIDNLMKEEE